MSSQTRAFSQKSPILHAVIDPRPGRHYLYLYNGAGSTAATRGRMRSKGAPARETCARVSASRRVFPSADTTGTGPGRTGPGPGPLSPLSLRRVYCKQQREDAATGGCGDPGAWACTHARGDAVRVGEGRGMERMRTSSLNI